MGKSLKRWPVEVGITLSVLNPKSGVDAIALLHPERPSGFALIFEPFGDGY